VPGAAAGGAVVPAQGPQRPVHAVACCLLHMGPGSGSRPLPGPMCSRSTARSRSSCARMKLRWNSRPASSIGASMVPAWRMRARVLTTRWCTTIRPSGSFSRTSWARIALRGRLLIAGSPAAAHSAGSPPRSAPA
jgi:hypothetical protein